MSKLAIKGGKPVRVEPYPGVRWPIRGKDEEEAVARVVRSNNLCGGSEKEQFESLFAKYCNAEFAIATSCGTTALHTALAAAGIGVGDEVIVPPYTFLSTATSVLMQNAIPIFADIEPDTLGLDPKAVREKITSRTRAIIPVHMNGYPADMDGLMAVTREHNLVVIEDCSHAHGAEHKGKKVGTIGNLGAFSFQQRKNLSLGEGGMVVTNNEEFAKRAEAFHSFGNVPLAFNYRMSPLHAAIGRVRLPKLDEQNEQRIRNAEYLDKNLKDIKGITSQKPRAGTKAVYYNYLMRYSEEEVGVDRAKFIEAVQAEGIPLLASYSPLNRRHTFKLKDAYGHGCPWECPFYTAPPEEKPRYEAGICPVAEEMYDKKLLDIKIHPPATLEDMADIVEAFRKVIDNVDELK